MAPSGRQVVQDTIAALALHGAPVEIVRARALTIIVRSGRPPSKPADVLRDEREEGDRHGNPAYRIGRLTPWTTSVPASGSSRTLGSAPGRETATSTRCSRPWSQQSRTPGRPAPARSCRPRWSRRSTLREVVWGVDTRCGPGAAGPRRVATARSVADNDGVHHAVDETGFGVGLTTSPAPPRSAPVTPARQRAGTRHPLERRPEPITPVRPLRMCHVA